MPVLLISRGTMSGVAPLVRRFAECSGYACVAREDLVALAKRHGDLAQRIVERLGNAAQAYEQLCELRRPYVTLMRAALLEYASRDALIYHGYSGHLLLPPVTHFIRIRIHAPAAMRIAMTKARLECTDEQARAHIAQDDEERVRWARFLYGQDIRDPALYDLCINLERTSTETVCLLLGALTNAPASQATPESAALVDRLLVASRVEAALVTDQRTATIEAGATATEGRVIVTGPYVDAARRAAVLDVARSVEGVDAVEYQYGFAPAFGAGAAS